MAAYAYACAKSGSPINWLADPKFKLACKNSYYGQCPSNLVYNDCSTNYLNSCRLLSLFENENNTNECVQGNEIKKILILILNFQIHID